MRSSRRREGQADPLRVVSYQAMATLTEGTKRPDSKNVASQRQVHVEGQEMEIGKWEATCWACKLPLVFPNFTPLFKCGYCGAVTSSDKETSEPRPRRSHRCNVILDRFLVSFVLVLVFSIVCGGVWTVFPIIFPSTSIGLLVHSAITALLAFNTLFNFAFAASIPAGPPPAVEWGQVEVVSRGALENYKFCEQCQKPKHPRAHHCSTCGACILDMDHHCPFIGNCVGASNHGYFILFLIFTLLSLLYVLIMAVYTCNYSRSLMVFQHDSLSEPGTSSLGIQLLAGVFGSLLFDNQGALTIRYIGLLYLFVASVALLIGVALLLYQQLGLVYSGQTYLDSIAPFLNEGDSGLSGGKGWKNLQRIFGKGHPILWLLPSTNTQKFHAR